MASSGAVRLNASEELIPKQPVRASTAPKKIAKIQFGTLLTDEICKVAEFEANNRDLLTLPDRVPAHRGCLDERLGVSDKMKKCKTCHQKLSECAGHFGYIQLKLPVFHAGYFKHTLTILQCICKSCSRMLLTLPDREKYLRILRYKQVDALNRAQYFKKIVELCKRNLKCPYCSTNNGVVKKLGGGTFKIIHDVGRAKGDISREEREHRRMLDEAIKSIPELNKRDDKRSKRGDSKDKKEDLVKTRLVELITPLRAFEILSEVTTEDSILLWMDTQFGRPESLIIWAVPVPPVPIRPSVPVDVAGGGTTEDDLTMKLQEIIFVNNALGMAMKKGAAMKMVTEDWEYLQIQVAQFINGETPGIPRAISGGKSIRGLCQRLKGKQGRFRGNLSGKRVDFSGRTVISPDPNLLVNQVGIPELVAKVMTYPERVFEHNRERLQSLIRNGHEKHPGANLIRKASHGSNKPPQSILLAYLDDRKREEEAKRLKVGDIVERHMCDDDIVLFNRQPSLHKMSIMAHNVKVAPWRTFRFNECACTPYNADFDGDEMNLHLPQTEEARAEASELMIITKNLVTPRNGEPLVAATQDFLTCAFLLTRKDMFFTRAEVARLTAYFSDAKEHVDIPPPAILKPRRLWSGKQIISLLVCPVKAGLPGLSFETQEKFYSNEDRFMCQYDGYVCFNKGELMCGQLGKKTLGGDGKQTLFYVLIRDHSSEFATKCMSRLAKFSARYIGDRGFSIGIEDVTPPQRLLDLKQGILKDGGRLADEQIAQYKSGSIRLKPGCDALQSLESEVNGLLGKIRQRCGDEAMRELSYFNAALCMAQCGSKGSVLNISQMIACCGQQSVGGSRIQDGFENRTLPHFPPGALYPGAKGFVGNSFYSGLTATEFFFHTMGGREGLVDTAVKTAETGYMARRLMKALEDLSMQYDNTVRNSEQTVVQFSYGDDSLNPHKMEKGDRPVDFIRLLKNFTVEFPFPSEKIMSSSEIRTYIANSVTEPRFTVLLPAGAKFLEEIASFFNAFADRLEALERLSLTSSIDVSDISDTLIGDTVRSIRAKLTKLGNAGRNKWRKQSQITGTKENRECNALLRENVHRLTISQLEGIISNSLTRYNHAIIEPGEAVGAIGAQSLSEPGTQMTLKTFHFAGVASMNVTLGVPRLKEIINASKTISTPIIEARLVQNDSMTSARIVKAQIEKTNLGEISRFIRAVHGQSSSYVLVRLDAKVIRNFHLAVDAFTVRHALLNPMNGHKSSLLRALKEKHVVVNHDYELQIFAPEMKEQKGQLLSSHQKLLFHIHALKAALPEVIIKGVPAISRAIINEEVNRVTGNKEYYLLLEGYGLAEVMGSPGVDGVKTKSNHIMDMQRVLGIEAARKMIADEIEYIMAQYAICVDVRHLMLLSDVMTFKGEVLGITRFGVAKMRESVLMLASFEKTTDHLFDAAVHSREDAIVGVSECIIMGVPIPLGTGLFKLLLKAKDPPKITKRVRLFDQISN